MNLHSTMRLKHTLIQYDTPSSDVRAWRTFVRAIMRGLKFICVYLIDGNCVK